MATEREYRVHLKRPHPGQLRFIESRAKRKVVRAGRRGGKTTGMAIMAVMAMLRGERVLYATPTADQLDIFWHEVVATLREPIAARVLYKNETKRVVSVPGTRTHIKAKTAWDADSLRGDNADLLILDEFQLMHEDAWGSVGAPMVADRDGTAVFIYTPPSLRTRARSRAKDPRHAAKLFKRAEAKRAADLLAGREPKWETFHFRSTDNPHISQVAVAGLAEDMTALAYKQEIEAEDVEFDPRALWNPALIEKMRWPTGAPLPDLTRLAEGVDPSGGAVETGIVLGGRDRDANVFVLADLSLLGSPATWGSMVVAGYDDWGCNVVAAEKNYGGDMVESTIQAAAPDRTVPVHMVSATRGKTVRAEPAAARSEKGKLFLVGRFPQLEEEMCSYVPGESAMSPNRLDAFVWMVTELVGGPTPAVLFGG